jgi:fluoroacetyl-CoA thioesterase
MLMKPTLAVGVATTAKLTVDRDRTIDFMGEAARVYATPMLVRDIEVACRNLLLEHLDAGEDSVGTRVEIDHTGATLMGMKVELKVAIAEVNGRRSPSRSKAATRRADLPCRHTRFVVDVTKTASAWPPRRQKAGLA